MKPFEAQTHYELLGVPANSAPEQIREAYEQRATLLDREAIEAFGLTSADDLPALRRRFDDAYAVLADYARRLDYDQQLAAGPSQLAMFDLLSPIAPPPPSQPEYSVSYIPHLPPRLPLSSDPPEAPAGKEDTAPRQPEEPHLPPRPSPPSLPRVSQLRQAAKRPTLVALSSGSMKPNQKGGKPAPAAGEGRSGPRRLELAADLSQEAAIGIAEASMAQLTARVRDGRPQQTEVRPKAFEVAADAEFNGELLRTVRDSRGLSVAQLADRTRISRAHLENIEADRYGSLPATVYLRGILMNIARELGLDPLRVSKSYLSLVAKGQK